MTEHWVSKVILFIRRWMIYNIVFNLNSTCIYDTIHMLKWIYISIVSDLLALSANPDVYSIPITTTTTTTTFTNNMSKLKKQLIYGELISVCSKPRFSKRQHISAILFNIINQIHDCIPQQLNIQVSYQ